jgi:hypothetical protein
MHQQHLFIVPGGESRMRRRILYVLACGDFVKIGYTARPIRRRISEMETGNPSRIQVIGTRELGDHEDDRAFHDRAKPWHSKREWFHKTPELLALIDEWLHGPEIRIAHQFPALGVYVIPFDCPLCGDSRMVTVDVRKLPFELRGRTKCTDESGVDQASMALIFGDCWKWTESCHQPFRIHLVGTSTDLVVADST